MSSDLASLVGPAIIAEGGDLRQPPRAASVGVHAEATLRLWINRVEVPSPL